MDDSLIDFRQFIRPPGLVAWLGGCWLNRERIAWAFAQQRQNRPGLRLHAPIGMLCCFTISFPYAVHEFVLPIAALASILRLSMTGRLIGQLFVQPIVLIAFAWLGFRFLSLAWTPDVEFGLIHLSEARFMLLLLALWPIMEYRTLLIGAYLAGMFVGNLVQLGEFVGLQTGWTWLIWAHHAPGRITGWWRPAFGGASLCVPLAIWLHVAFIAMGQRVRFRRLAVVMSVVTLGAIVASGTRGAWLAGAATIGLVVAVRTVRFLRDRAVRAKDQTGQHSPDRTRAVSRAMIVAGVVLFLGSLLLVPRALDRVSAAKQEIGRAIQEGDFDSDTGARLLMWIEAGRAMRSHPIFGLGEGGYREWAREDASRRIDPRVALRIQEHAHGTIAHIGATGGLVGLAMFALLMGAALLCAFSAPRRGQTGLERSLLLALIALLMVGQFETMHVGSRLKQHMWLLLALSPAYVPVQRVFGDPDGEADG